VTEWKDDDEFTTTYGTLRQAMAEAAEAERERIIELIKIVDYTVLVKTDEHDELDVMEQEELFALIRSAQK
jgi:hypothetical protein